jgi:cytochrome c-type biogenesis protein CcmF
LWIIISALVDPVDRLRRGLSLAPAVLGMTMAHVGLGIITLGVTTMETRMVERDVALSPGQDVSIGDYRFRFDGVQALEGPNYDAQQGRVVVTREGDSSEVVLLPERRTYWVQQQTLAEAALGVSWRRDLLATLGEDLGNGVWSVRLQVRPLMRYVWLGAGLMALGGLLATLDKRYRRRKEAPELQTAAMPVGKAPSPHRPAGQTA